jgi:hypothetical protein
MAEVTTALGNLKTLLLTVNPTPEPAIASAYVYPGDSTSINFETVPFAIISEDIATPGEWHTGKYNTMVHRWTAEVLIVLDLGSVTNPEEQSTAAAKVEPWYKAVALILKTDTTLSDTIWPFGSRPDTEGRYFTYQSGAIPLFNQDFWGLIFKIPIQQEVIV